MRPKCGRCVRVGVECDYKRSLRWCNGARLPRARKPRPRREPRAAADAESGRESSVTTSPAESSSTVHEWAETPGAQHASPEAAVPEPDDSATVPQSYPPEAGIERVEGEVFRGNANRQLNSNDFASSLTPAGSSARREGSGGEEGIELVRVRDVEPAWSLQTPLDGHLCSMLFQDDGSHLAYLYCKDPSKLIYLLSVWLG